MNGARSWIRLAGFQFQPSEIAKLALLLWMAHVLAARRSTLGSPKALLIPVLPVFVLMAGLIMLQPDLGTTVALTIVFMAVLFFAGAPWWTFAGLAVAGYGRASSTWPSRPTTGWPGCCPSSTRRPIRTSRTSCCRACTGWATAAGSASGSGQSRAKWSYLPNADSDFIFAIIGEELGLIGAGILLLLFALLAYTGLRIARRNVDPFVKIVASAATVWLVGQAAINIGYVVGLLPVTGIPLPMISAGGTSLLITMVVFGLAGELRPPGTAGRRRPAGRRGAAGWPGSWACRTPTAPRAPRSADAAAEPPPGRRRRAGRHPAGRFDARRRARGHRDRPRHAAPPLQRNGPVDHTHRRIDPVVAVLRAVGEEGREIRFRACYAADRPREAGTGRPVGSAAAEPIRLPGDRQRGRAADPAGRDRRSSAPPDPRGARNTAGHNADPGARKDRRPAQPLRATPAPRDGAGRTRAPRSNGPRGGDAGGRNSRWDGA